MSGPALVIGYGVTGQAVTDALRARGCDVVVVDDRPSQPTRAAAAAAGVELRVAPESAELGELVGSAHVLVPSPGIPDRHPVFALAAAAGVGTISEFDLARVWDDRPTLAVTGTDGKTTVTTLVAEILESSGFRTAAVGNTETPLVAALGDPTLDLFVVEASSFRLGHSRRFEPAVGTWLNFGPDHLDVHSSLDAYEAAKAKIFAAAGVAVANAADPVVMGHFPGGVTFGTADADVRRQGDVLVAHGAELLAVDELWRQLPHDVANALAAAATALAGGATVDGVRDGLRSFRGLPHRVELVAEADGVRWYDDSKATAPHAAISAASAFGSVVLIAGGLNKGLDLSELAVLAPRLRTVVAIGDAADEVAAVFAGRCPVVRASSMQAAVTEGATAASSGDVVLLSPACASFDWYGSYAERGDDFASAVRDQIGGVP